MTLDVRRLLVVSTFALFLTGCGAPKSADNVFEKSSDQCLTEAVPGQFIVRNIDGSVEIVRAASKDEFIRGYLTENLARVDFAEHDFKVRASTPNGSTPVAQATIIADNWGADRIHADELWKSGVRGNGVLVAVIDTGVDINHPQLSSRIYTNTGETGLDSHGNDRATNGVDDDNNGFADDVHGWNFVSKKPLKGDNSIHGTHVAGIIASAHADLVAEPTDHVQGIAPQAKILPLAFLDSFGEGQLSYGVLAIRYAARQGAKVINASWGGDQCSRALREEIRQLAARDIVFVAAAGNESRDVDTLPSYPASLNLTAQITVGATGTHDFMATYSNYGVRAVHIFAPGTNIVSTLPDNRYGTLSGTSMAAPFIAGAVALLLSAVPDATVSQIREALYNTAFHSDYLNASRGRADLTQTLTELQHLHP